MIIIRPFEGHNAAIFSDYSVNSIDSVENTVGKIQDIDKYIKMLNNSLYNKITDGGLFGELLPYYNAYNGWDLTRRRHISHRFAPISIIEAEVVRKGDNITSYVLFNRYKYQDFTEKESYYFDILKSLIHKKKITMAVRPGFITFDIAVNQLPESKEEKEELDRMEDWTSILQFYIKNKKVVV